MSLNQNRFNLILALHNHQPVGNLPEVFENTFEQAYRPFVEVLAHHPEVKVTLHYTGILLEWIEKHRPEFLDKLRQLISRGQVEIMGGAYYEPILPIIPDEDKKGQIRLLNDRIKELLHTVPQGMWLAERIWEPHLARPIASSGLRYITVDDAHFHEVGFKDLYHYYLTEEEGWELCIFPVSEKLRYLIPFRPVEEVISFLHQQLYHDKGDLLVLADDGEKFGSWPETYKAVYLEKWLDHFFTALGEHRDWLRTVTFSEYMELEPPEGPVYIPAAAYREMKEWSRGYWRNFLTRYPESNRMHKKMLNVRRRINKMPESKNKEEAFRYLWAGQCNCAYWHGVFGGLYLNFLRSAIWENLLKAEELAESQLQRKEHWLEIRVKDFDYDGHKEAVVASDRFSLLFAPHLGGSMWEMSWRPAAANFLDTLTRRPEKYHRDLVEQESAPSEERREKNGGVKSIHDLQGVKESDLQNHLQYDAYPRGSLIDHFLPSEETGMEDFKKGKYRDDAGILLQPFTMELRRLEKRSEQASLIFRRRVSRNEYDFLLEKEVMFQAGSDRFRVNYTLENYSSRVLGGRLGVELNLAFMSGYSGDRYFHIPGRHLENNYMASEGAEQEVETLEMYDDWRGVVIALNFNYPVLLWRFPVETVSRSEEGMERVYQQSVIVPQWQLGIPPGESRELTLDVDFRFKAQEYPGGSKELTTEGVE